MISDMCRPRENEVRRVMIDGVEYVTGLFFVPASLWDNGYLALRHAGKHGDKIPVPSVMAKEGLFDRPEGMVAHHINGNVMDNRVGKNLVAVTQADNARWRTR